MIIYYYLELEPLYQKRKELYIYNGPATRRTDVHGGECWQTGGGLISGQTTAFDDSTMPPTEVKRNISFHEIIQANLGHTLPKLWQSHNAIFTSTHAAGADHRIVMQKDAV